MRARSIVNNPKRLLERAEAYERSARACGLAPSQLEEDSGMSRRTKPIVKDMDGIAKHLQKTARDLRALASK